MKVMSGILKGKIGQVRRRNLRDASSSSCVQKKDEFFWGNFDKNIENLNKSTKDHK